MFIFDFVQHFGQLRWDKFYINKPTYLLTIKHIFFNLIYISKNMHIEDLKDVQWWSDEVTWVGRGATGGAGLFLGAMLVIL